MNTCDYCIHVEMCGWRKELNEGGCEFYDDGNRWIPISLSMPKDESYVLTTIHIPGRQPRIRSGWYQSGRFHNDNGDVWRDTDREVKAWMYQPEPYKEDADEDSN